MSEEAQIRKLLAGCRRRDRRAQMEIYERYNRQMYNTALRIVNDSIDAEDVMQEAFIKAFAKLDRFEFRSSFGAWLKKIVIRESLQWLRKNTVFRIDEEEESGVIQDEEIEIEEVENTGVKQLLEALSKLKAHHRILLSLHYIEGYDYEEMMQITSMSYANLRTTISRAKQKLKTALLQKI